MLKITAVDNDQRRTLVLEGQLIDPWVGELERNWAEARMSIGADSIVVDLRDITAISEGGENALFQMMAAGAQIHCRRGVLTKHVLQQLKQRCKSRSSRSIARDEGRDARSGGKV